MRSPSVVLSLLATLAACVPLQSRIEPRDPTPDALVLEVRRAAREKEWGDLYDRLSHAARKKVSRIEFAIGFPTCAVPPPHGYKVADIVAYGACDGVLPDPENPDRAIVFYSYHQAGKPRFDIEVLVVNEAGTWRVEGPQ
ncbi:MAG: hypothetical protein ACAI25_02505 [Planctomycetota bacterium]